ncbi:hypothetical protein SNEBB_006523 [Seison nebaliae]|nr:hypothetical protein SNEBB_006523 [Seison nebaliae]
MNRRLIFFLICVMLLSNIDVCLSKYIPNQYVPYEKYGTDMIAKRNVVQNGNLQEVRDVLNTAISHNPMMQHIVMNELNHKQKRYVPYMNVSPQQTEAEYAKYKRFMAYLKELYRQRKNIKT